MIAACICSVIPTCKEYSSSQYTSFLLKGQSVKKVTGPAGDPGLVAKKVNVHGLAHATVVLAGEKQSVRITAECSYAHRHILMHADKHKKHCLNIH